MSPGKRFALILLLLLLSLPSCSRGHSSEELEFWTISLKPLFTGYMEETISSYESSHPRVKIRWVDVPIQAVASKLLATLASGSPPSVVNLNSEYALQFAEMEALINLDEFLSQKEKSLYFQGLWNAAAYRGGHYAFPWYVTTQVLIYNRKIFQAAGLNPDQPPDSLEEIARLSRVIKEKTGLYGFMPSIKLIDELLLDGIPVVSADGKEALFGTPEAEKKLEFYGNLFQKQIIPSESLQLAKSYLRAVEMFQAGTLAMIITGPQFLNRIRDNAPEIYKVTDVAPAPRGKAGIVPAATMNLVIPLTAPKKEEAIRFALHMTSDANQLAFCKLVPVLPSTKQAAKDPFFFSKEGPEGDPLLQKGRRLSASQLPLAKDLNLGLKNAKDRNEVIKDMLEGVLLGKVTPAEGLRESVRQWNLLLR